MPIMNVGTDVGGGVMECLVTMRMKGVIPLHS